jgi:hypothetical protein
MLPLGPSVPTLLSMLIVLAFVEDHVRVAWPPGATVAGDATSCTVGALEEVGEGDGFGVGVGEALLAFTPPHPVRISSAEADTAKAILVTVKR